MTTAAAKLVPAAASRSGCCRKARAAAEHIGLKPRNFVEDEVDHDGHDVRAPRGRGAAVHARPLNSICGTMLSPQHSSVGGNDTMLSSRIRVTQGAQGAHASATDRSGPLEVGRPVRRRGAPSNHRT